MKVWIVFKDGRDKRTGRWWSKIERIFDSYEKAMDYIDSVAIDRGEKYHSVDGYEHYRAKCESNDTSVERVRLNVCYDKTYEVY